MQLIQCPNCAKVLPIYARYCAYCGESLNAPAYKSSLYLARYTQRTRNYDPDMDATTDSALPRVNKQHVSVKLDMPQLLVAASLTTNQRMKSTRPATVNNRHAREERATYVLTKDVFETDTHDEMESDTEHRELTWQKDVITMATQALPPITPFPSPHQQSPVRMVPKRSRRRLPITLFFWISTAVIAVLVLGGVFGVFVSLGRGLLPRVSQDAPLSLQVAPSTVVSGGTVTLRGTNFTPRGHIGLSRDSAIPLVDTGGMTIISTDSLGHFTDTVIIGDDWGAGVHVLSAEDAFSHKLAKFSIVVTGQSGAFRPAHFHISQTALDLGSGDEATNSTQTVTLTNTGGGQISWQATATQPWLQISPAKGEFASGQRLQVAIAADRSTLNTGPYNGSILFSSNAGKNSLAVHMQVVPLEVGHEAVLELQPAVLSFTGNDGGKAPATQTITISNPGVRVLQWAAHSSAPWLSLSVSGDTVQPASSETVRAAINSSTLLPGTYNGTITFSNQGSDPVKDSPQTIYVSVTILPQCTLQVSPGALTFASVYQQAAPATKTVNLSMSQGCTTPINWTASSTASWLRIASGNGTTPASPTIGVDITSLVPGTYTASLIVSSASGTQTIPVTFTLSQPAKPVMSNALTALSFSGAVGQASPAGQQVVLANNGGGALQWQATATTTTGGKWLTLAPASGSLAGGQTVPIGVSAAQLSTLTPGSYSGMVTITGIDSTGHTAAGSPEVIPVTFNVQAACSISTSPIAALTFSSVAGQSTPLSQTLTLSAAGACAHALTWTITAATTPTGGTWLVPTPATGSANLATPGTVSIGVASTNLTTGNYTGSITLKAVDSVTKAPIGTAQTIPVTLTVQPPCTLQTVSSSSASFSAEAGHNPAAQTFTLGVTGACKGNVTITPTITYGAGSGWLAVTPSSALVLTGSSTPFTLAISTASLPAGTYTASISLAGTNGGVTIAGSPQTVTVTLTVSAAPTLSIAPASLTINTTAGTSSTPITLTNSGGGSLNWTAALGTGAPSFVSLSASGGSNVQGNTNTTVTIDVNAASATAGQTYTANVVFTATDPLTGLPVAGSPITVPVTINVAAPAMQVSTTHVAFSTASGPNPAPQTVVISNTGGGTLTWTAGTPSASWLSVGPVNGSNVSGSNASLTLAVNPAGLSANTYTATVVVTPSAGSPVTITATLTVVSVATPTPTPTAVPTPRVEATPTPTATATEAPQPTPSPTASISPTANPTPKVETTPTTVPTQPPQPTPTPTEAIQPTPTPTEAVQPTPTPTQAPQPTSTPNAKSEATTTVKHKHK